MDESMDFDADSSMLMLGGGGGGSGESIKVLVRVRPLSEQERVENHGDSMVDILSNNQLTVTSNDHRKTFTCSYDAVLGPQASQGQVYDTLKECSTAVLSGINCTICAYGQTGSGKTHSMYGPPNFTNPNNPSHLGRDIDQLGVIPRAIHHLFEQAKTPGILDFQVHCSFVQIYNENLYDMLRDSAMNQALTIREDNQKQIYVQGLSEYGVKNVSDTLMLLKIAEENRAVRETHMNMFSSRSHSIFQIYVEHKRLASDGGEVTYRAKFNLVDLAGSEKWDMVSRPNRELKAEHIAEMTNINLSLHTLGKCISALAKMSRRKRKQAMASASDALDNTGGLDSRSVTSVDINTPSASNKASSSKPGTSSGGGYHVPYRESKLTRLLQDSLGGTAKTFLIATVSPARSNFDETISTLKFADRAKQVMVQAVTNEIRPVDHALVQRLKMEVSLYRSVLQKVLGHPNANSAGVIADAIQQSLMNMNSRLVLADAERQMLVTLLREQTALAVGGMAQSANVGGVAMEGYSQNVGSSQQQNMAAGFGSPGKPSSNSYNNVQPMSSPKAGNRSPDKRKTADYNVEAAQQGASDVVPGGGLEYIISLEKALNREQVHAQHLMQKNETLIKELEELKMHNMQLSFQSQRPPSASSNHINNTNTNTNSSAMGLQLPEAEIRQVVDSVHQLLQQNDALYLHTDTIQKVMKKFFKYQIEEEEMKDEINKVFDVLKEEKSIRASKKVNDNFAFLEYLQQQAAQSSSSSINSSAKAGGYPAPMANAFMDPNTSTTPLRKSKDGKLSKQQSAQSQPQVVIPQPTAKNMNSVPPLQQSQSLPHLAPLQSQTAPMMWPQQQIPLQQPQQQPMSAQGARFSNPAFPGYSPMAYPQQQQAPFFPQGYPGSFPSQQQPQPGYSVAGYPQQYGGYNGVNTSGQFAPQFMQQAPLGYPQQQHTASYLQVQTPTSAGNNITIRVRQGAETDDSAEGVNIFQGAPDGETEEERVARELKKAKKKQKQKEKLQQWMREKEERAATEKKMQEEEKRNLMEAEAMREQKRKEYVSKQKAKLQQYQVTVKGEAEKIQQLINLGIDPNSLNL